MDSWLVVLIGIQTSFLGAVIWIGVNYRIQKSRQRTEERIRLLDRFQSSEDLERFLTSEAGSLYLKTSASRKVDPRWALVLCVGLGVVSLFLGLGLLIIAANHAEQAFLVLFGAVLTSLGIGLFAAPLVSSIILRFAAGGSNKAS